MSVKIFKIAENYLKSLPGMADVQVVDAWEQDALNAVQVCVDVTMPETVSETNRFYSCYLDIMILSDRSCDPEHANLNSLADMIVKAFRRHDVSMMINAASPGETCKIEGVLMEKQDFSCVLKSFNARTIKLKIFYKEV